MGRQPGIRSVGRVDRDPHPGQIDAEALEDVLEVRVGRDLDVLDLALVDSRRRREQLLDLLLRDVRQLVALRVEELDAVVLRRVVGGRDDDAQVEREQCDGRRGQHPAQDAVATGGDDAARERLLELDPGRARVPAHEDLGRAGPERCGPAEALDELGRDELAHDAAHPIGAEVLAGHDERLSAC